MANAATNMALANTRWTKDQNSGPLVNPGVPAGQCHDVGLGEHRHLGKLEAGQRLGRIELRLGAMALYSPLGPFSQFVFQQPTQKATRRPTLLVRALGKLRPQSANRGQAKFVEHQSVAGWLERLRTHASTSSCALACVLGS